MDPVACTRRNQWGSTEVTLQGDRAVVEYLRDEPRPIGCRLVAIGLAHVAACAGAVDRLPPEVLLRSRRYAFAPRALGTVEVLRDPASRLAFLEGYSWRHLPSRDGEGWREYEARVGDEMAAAYAGHRRLPRERIHVGGGQGYPDALLQGATDGTLLIVEAKKRPKDFAEGTSQLLQYYAKARSDPEFRGRPVRTLLVTSSTKETPEYGLWKELMASRHDFRLTTEGP